MKLKHILSEALIDESLFQLLNDRCWLVYDSSPSCLAKENVHFFKSKGDALSFFEANRGSGENHKIVYVLSVMDLISKLSYGESIDIRPHKIDQPIKMNVMNEQNFQYLKDNMKYLGFGEGLEEILKENMKKGLPEFSILCRTEVNKKPFEAELNFRKSDSTDLYFLNGYSATLQRGNGEKMGQHFYVNHGKGVTAKEAYNLLEGRAVYKELTNREGERYKAWLQIDFSARDKNNHPEMKQFHENYGYDLKEAVAKFSVLELKDGEKEKALMHSLQKGNMQMVYISTDVGVSKMFLEANPQYKTVNLYDANLRRVQKEEMTQYLRPSSSMEKTQGASQGQDATREQKKATDKNLRPPAEDNGKSKGRSMRA